MRMKIGLSLAVIAAALAASACSKSDDGNTATATANTAATGYLAKVAALPPGQVRGVLFRAIADASGDCQAISDMKRAPDKDGRARWGVRCTNGKEWNVSIGDDGVAQVGSQN
jgi:hypothetical protein